MLTDKGGGPGGYVAAIKAAQEGLKVWALSFARGIAELTIDPHS